jgi:MMP 1-O-methyltransferase
VPLPKAVRRLTPDAIRHDVRLRALAVGSGLIPPRLMHTRPEADLLAQLAAPRRTAVEIGVYEGSSALVLTRALPVDAVLHLIDPFVDSRGLAAGWRGTAWATRRVVERAVLERGGPTLRWHLERSQDAGQRWGEPVDLVFVDGDHSEAGCELDWTLWHPHVTPGGRVVFHDARDGSADGRGLPGPTAVVERTFRNGGPPPGWAIEREIASMVVVRRD